MVSKEVAAFWWESRKKKIKCSKSETSLLIPPEECRPSGPFSSELKSQIGNILAKAAALRIVLNIDGAPVASRSHTHPSHSQASRLYL